ncbi:hypothetical protein Pan44_08890 [Caulifigura coniformis]|uniref:DUF1499 domain-containing protein n=2 Tax=Caulifigura coniformis TaxID=2527983 RepID=A0A517S9W6_9PLAN|nr:hypothetical protein Pan44_08890 [Caulifigura coniformis]
MLRGVMLSAVFLSPYLVTWNQPAPSLGASLGGLSRCPRGQHCVSSEFSYILTSNFARQFQQPLPERPSHFIEPFELADDSIEGWKLLVETVRSQPGVTILETTGSYLHAVRSTTIYGLIDDFELSRLHTGTVLVRSCARLGYSDFGRNRRFVEKIRSEFAKQPREQWF